LEFKRLERLELSAAVERLEWTDPHENGAEWLNDWNHWNDLNRSGAVVWGKLKYDQVFCAR
jgi:hypothetical protein